MQYTSTRVPPGHAGPRITFTETDNPIISLLPKSKRGEGRKRLIWIEEGGGGEWGGDGSEQLVPFIVFLCLAIDWKWHQNRYWNNTWRSEPLPALVGWLVGWLVASCDGEARRWAWKQVHHARISHLFLPMLHHLISLSSLPWSRHSFLLFSPFLPRPSLPRSSCILRRRQFQMFSLIMFACQILLTNGWMDGRDHSVRKSERVGTGV